MGGIDNLVQQFIHGGLDIKQIHPGCGHHDIAGCHVGHANDALQHQPGLNANDVVVLRLDQCLN